MGQNSRPQIRYLFFYLIIRPYDDIHTYFTVMNDLNVNLLKSYYKIHGAAEYERPLLQLWRMIYLILLFF